MKRFFSGETIFEKTPKLSFRKKSKFASMLAILNVTDLHSAKPRMQYVLYKAILSKDLWQVYGKLNSMTD